MGTGILSQFRCVFLIPLLQQALIEFRIWQRNRIKCVSILRIVTFHDMKRIQQIFGILFQTIHFQQKDCRPGIVIQAIPVIILLDVIADDTGIRHKQFTVEICLIFLQALVHLFISVFLQPASNENAHADSFSSSILVIKMGIEQMPCFIIIDQIRAIQGAPWSVELLLLSNESYSAFSK